ncbi:MAG: matrixin family metalloprotease [bacterium]|nr:matrixin family metalloprotease [bacterium]
MKWRLGVFGLVGALLIGCQTGGTSYEHSRYDYWSFRARSGRLPEPNYLPWALHEESLPLGGRGYVVCRWPDDAFPLRYYVESPIIREELQDEFRPRDPGEFVAAVERAFDIWQKAIGRPVRFQRVHERKDARLVVHMQADKNERAEGFVLGVVRDETERCQIQGRGEQPDQVRIEYQVDDAYLYISDSVGLLTPHQVQSIALHEIGHVLGVSGQHSPLRGDVMYRVASDRRVDALSQHDTNTLRALYRLAPGRIYVRTDEARSKPLSEVRRDPPRLDHELRDDRYDVEVRFPRGWQVIRSARGWIAIDGLSWDYDASIQVVSGRGDFDPEYAPLSLNRLVTGEIQRSEMLEIDGQPIARVVASSDGRTEEISMIGWQKGWLVFVIADCRSEDYQLYQPWFRSVLLSLDHPVEAAKVWRRKPGVSAPPR